MISFDIPSRFMLRNRGKLRIAFFSLVIISLENSSANNFVVVSISLRK